jgi:hypothetical protein
MASYRSYSVTGPITSAAEVLRALQAVGLHLDQQTIAVALRRVAGEEWRP